jgi:hypothetical protein
MELLLQLFAVLGSAVLLSVMLSRRPIRAWLDPRKAAVTVAIAAAALFCWSVWGEAKTFVDLRRDLAGLDGFQADTALGRAEGQNVAFLEWADRRIPARDTFQILPRDLPRRVDRFIPYGWSTFQLSPRRSVDGSEADWLVFYGVPPESVSWDRIRFGRPLRFGRRFAIAPRMDAG